MHYCSYVRGVTAISCCGQLLQSAVAVSAAIQGRDQLLRSAVTASGAPQACCNRLRLRQRVCRGQIKRGVSGVKVRGQRGVVGSKSKVRPSGPVGVGPPPVLTRGPPLPPSAEKSGPVRYYLTTNTLAIPNMILKYCES